MTETEYVAKTTALMEACGVRMRVTYDLEFNHDESFSNGNRPDSHRLMQITWSEDTVSPVAGALKKYSLPGHASIAYDSYRIGIPERYRTNGRDDPVIHECVHFLQHATWDEDHAYILGSTASQAA